VRPSHFDEAAAVYHRMRPQYPPPLFDALFELLPDDRMPRVIEVGPGTGQATSALLARGALVTAVEVGPQLAAHLDRTYRRQDRLTVLNAAFEDVALEPAAWDVVIAATSYHWVATEARLARPAALLVDSGVLAVVDTIQVRSPVDRDFFERAQVVYSKYEDRPWVAAPEPDEATPPIVAELEASDCFEQVTLQRFRWDQVYDAQGYGELVRSYSNVAIAAEQREALIAELEALVAAEEGGFVVRPLIVTLTTARRVPR
jgi:SAM-dependent methyltransferase